MNSKFYPLQPYIGLPGITSFRPGQGEATQRIIDIIEAERNCIIELEAPTSAGKTLILSTVGNYESSRGRKKVVYCTPQIALADQISKSGLRTFEGRPVPVLLGRSRYVCALNSELDCAQCLYGDKAQKCPAKAICPYEIAKREFFASSFGITTLAYAVFNPKVKKDRDVLLVDESDKLEEDLLIMATSVLPPQVLVKDMHGSHTIDRDKLLEWQASMKIKRAEAQIRLDSIRKGLGGTIGKIEGRQYITLIKEITGERNKLDRTIRKASAILMLDGDTFLIDENKFRPISGKLFFQTWSRGKVIVLASGTPMTMFLADNYHKVSMKHPIPADRRQVIYSPVSPMGNSGKSPEGYKAIGNKIIELHEKEAAGRLTLVHCHSEALAKTIFGAIGSDRRVILQEAGRRRGLSLEKWRGSHDKILLSFAMDRGLDLKGAEYPLNIIIKVPFPYLGDKVVAKRKELDSGHHYNMTTAIGLMQASGRTTRDPTDFSKTYILDTNFGSFFANNRELFSEWFLEALKRANGESMKEPKIPRWLMENREQSLEWSSRVLA